MLHVAMEQCRAGDILMVSPTLPSDAGCFGELPACSAMARGPVEPVIEASVRGVAALTKMPFPVWSRAVSVQSTAEATLGSVGIHHVRAGQMAQPGALVLTHDDGVVIVPRPQTADVICVSGARERKEDRTPARLPAGEMCFDTYGMQEESVLQRLTCSPAATE